MWNALTTKDHEALGVNIVATLPEGAAVSDKFGALIVTEISDRLPQSEVTLQEERLEVSRVLCVVANVVDGSLGLAMLALEGSDLDIGWNDSAFFEFDLVIVGCYGGVVVEDGLVEICVVEAEIGGVSRYRGCDGKGEENR
ncbi:MAG: hypothetical protein L6R41_004127 [Letrouitia leprolyta]|nr:MAG: hypothetical protein L6R41_004127 [Letrouitia leprolyta]